MAKEAPINNGKRLWCEIIKDYCDQEMPQGCGNQTAGILAPFVIVPCEWAESAVKRKAEETWGNRGGEIKCFSIGRNIYKAELTVTKNLISRPKGEISVESGKVKVEP